MSGSKPAFGASNTTSAPGTSVFGQNESATSPIEQPQQQQPRPTSTLFGAKPAGTGVFGQSTTSTAAGTSILGSTTAQTSGGGLFGQSKPSLVDASSANSKGVLKSAWPPSLTAGSATWFGSVASDGVPIGTTVKYTPLFGMDAIHQNGAESAIGAKWMGITTMKQYETKSLEELRLEDYLAGRKTPAPAKTSANGLFGSTTAFPSTGITLFGSPIPQKQSIFCLPSTADTLRSLRSAPALKFTFGFGETGDGPYKFGSPVVTPALGSSMFGKTTDFTITNTKKAVQKGELSTVSIDDEKSKEFLLKKIAELGGKLAIRDVEIAEKKKEQTETTLSFRTFRALKNREIKDLKEVIGKLRKERGDNQVKNGYKDEIASMGQYTAMENSTMSNPYRDETFPTTSSKSVTTLQSCEDCEHCEHNSVVIKKGSHSGKKEKK